MKLSKLPIAALSLAVALAACAETQDEAEIPADTAAMAPAAADAPPAAPVTVDLDDVDDSGVSGEVTATHSTNEVTVAIVLNEGGQAATNYPAHIHTGTCEAGGPVAVELSPVSNLQSSTTVPLSSLPANQDAFVQVHDASGKPIACGDLKGHGDGDLNATPHTTTTSH